MRSLTLLITALYIIFNATIAQNKNEAVIYNLPAIDAPTPVLLKLNDNYLFYSAPISPFISKQGRTTVPLRAVGKLLGFKVSYENQPKLVVTAKRSGHSLQFIKETNMAFFDDQPLTLDTPPIWHDQELLIPIKLLLDNFQIPFSWNGEHRILSINDPKALQNSDVTATFNNKIPNAYENTDVFIPNDIKLQGFRLNPSLSNDPAEITMSLKTSTPTDQSPELFLFAQSSNQGSGIVSGANTNESSPSLCQESSDFYLCQETYQLTEPIDYLIGQIKVSNN